MKYLVRQARWFSEKYHIPIHLISGVFISFVIHIYYPSAPVPRLVLFGMLGSLLPDADHFLYYFIYGRHSLYARIAKHFLLHRQFRDWVKFVKTNHKQNTGIYSHNILSLFLTWGLFWHYGISGQRPISAVFWLSWSVHYLFDIFEDLLFMKRVNTNWYLKFNRSVPQLDLSAFDFSSLSSLFTHPETKSSLKPKPGSPPRKTP